MVLKGNDTTSATGDWQKWANHVLIAIRENKEEVNKCSEELGRKIEELEKSLTEFMSTTRESLAVIKTKLLFGAGVVSAAMAILIHFLTKNI